MLSHVLVPSLARVRASMTLDAPLLALALQERKPPLRRLQGNGGMGIRGEWGEEPGGSGVDVAYEG
eukprot:4299473-Pleurochrysis_carterae.AAC.1